MTKWLSARLQTKWLWVRISLLPHKSKASLIVEQNVAFAFSNSLVESVEDLSPNYTTMFDVIDNSHLDR